MYIVIGVLPVFLGLAASTMVQTNPELASKLTDSERTVSVLSEHFLPSWHYVIFGGALISAILSVVHSALHASGAQVSHNIVVRIVPGMGGRENQPRGRDRIQGSSRARAAASSSSAPDAAGRARSRLSRSVASKMCGPGGSRRSPCGRHPPRSRPGRCRPG